MTTPAPLAANDGRRRRLASVLLALVGILLLVGAIGAENIELFTDLVFVRAGGGREYLVARHRSLLPFEDEGFVYLHRSGPGEPWQRAERRSGDCSAVAAREGRLLVYHESGYSLYEGGERLSYHDVPLEWAVRTAATRGEELYLFGTGKRSIEGAIVAGPAIRFSTIESPDAYRGRRFRTLAEADRLLLFWNERGRTEDSPWRLLWTTVDGGRLGEPRPVEFEASVEDFDVVESEGTIRFYLYAGPDADREDALYRATWKDGALLEPRRLDLPAERFLGRRPFSLAAAALPAGSARLYLSTFGAIEAFRIDPATAAAAPADDVIALSNFARERVLVWLGGLGLVSALLFLTGLRMFQARVREVPSIPVPDELPAEPQPPAPQADPAPKEREPEE